MWKWVVVPRECLSNKSVKYGSFGHLRSRQRRAHENQEVLGRGGGEKSLECF